MKNFAIKVGISWAIYEAIKFLLSTLFAIILGAVIPKFFEATPSDPDKINRLMELIDISSVIAVYSASFMAFTCVCYFFFRSKASSNETT